MLAPSLASAACPWHLLWGEGRRVGSPSCWLPAQAIQAAGLWFRRTYTHLVLLPRRTRTQLPRPPCAQWPSELPTCVLFHLLDPAFQGRAGKVIKTLW